MATESRNRITSRSIPKKCERFCTSNRRCSISTLIKVIITFILQGYIRRHERCGVELRQSYLKLWDHSSLHFAYVWACFQRPRKGLTFGTFKTTAWILTKILRHFSQKGLFIRTVVWELPMTPMANFSFIQITSQYLIGHITKCLMEKNCLIKI